MSRSIGQETWAGHPPVGGLGQEWEGKEAGPRKTASPAPSLILEHPGRQSPALPLQAALPGRAASLSLHGCIFHAAFHKAGYYFPGISLMSC